MNREEWIVELNHRINKVKGNHFDFIELHTDHAEEIVSLLKEQEPKQVNDIAQQYSDISTFNPRLICRGDACAYLRVDDYNPEHDFIDDCIENATRISFEEARITPTEWKEVKDDSMIRDIMRVAVFYSLGWLYEHKDEDQHDLRLTLRNLLFEIRERKLWNVSQ